MYSGIEEPSRWLLPAVLQEQAATRGDSRWVTMTSGETWTFAQAWQEVRQVAQWFAAQGVQPGDHVAVMAGSGIDFVRAWLGLGTLGAVAVLLNTELHGSFLEHQLANCGARLIVAEASLAPAVIAAAAACPQLRHIALFGGADAPASCGKLVRLPWEGDGGWAAQPAYEGPLPQASDTACIMYTSGTTGPAKGVLMPHAHCMLFGVGACEAAQLRDGDSYYIVLPLFHANGLLMQLGATLIAGIPAIVRPRFSAAAWLQDLRRYGATVTNTLGVVASYVVAQPETAGDKDHSLRLVMSAPNAPENEAVLRSRFGIADVISGYGMTEVNICIWGRPGQARPGAAGWPYARYFDVIIADPQSDVEQPRGTMGEILVRPRLPFGFMQGYHGMPDKTVEAWRNLWFHTGDAAVMDADGVVTFVDRIKDCIRRRGENISATEVESAVARFEGVAEVAAYAVPSAVAGGEDEVMLAIVRQPRASFRAEDLLAFADQALPRFAQPRYVAFMEALPKTANGKVQRAALRRAGTAGAFDRMAR